MSEQNNRTRLVQTRMTPAEYKQLDKKFSKSTCRKLSAYIRYVLLDKPITVTTRNQSLDDFMTEMMALRSELNAIGNNYNQLIKRLHVLRDTADVKAWLALHESARKILFGKIDEIKSKINQIDDAWLAG